MFAGPPGLDGDLRRGLAARPGPLPPQPGPLRASDLLLDGLATLMHRRMRRDARRC